MNQIVYEGPGCVRFEDGAPPNPKEGECVIKVAYAGVCGSDLNIFHGVHPRAQAPLTLGHEFSGRIVSGHPSIPPGMPVSVYPLLSCGSCVPCESGNPHVCSTLRLIGIDRNGGMAESVSIPADLVVPLPESLRLDHAAFVEPLAVAVHAVRRSGYRPGDRVAVFGAGPIGLSVALCLRYFGASTVVILERNPFRKRKADELGFPVIDPSDGTDPRDALRALTGKPDADIVFDCAAHPSVQDWILKLTRVQGTGVIVGSYKNPPPVDLLALEFKELSLIGIRVYTRDDFDIAIRLADSGAIEIDKLLSIFKPENAPDVFAKLVGGADIIKALFQMGEEA